MRRQTLRVVHERTRSEGERVAIALSAPARPVRRASVPFSWTLAAADAADIRWYLEDYLDAPYDPAPQIAARVEGRMREIGADLFSAVFDAHAEARALWRAVASQLNATRVVVTSAPDVAVGIPWELIADPASGQTLATDARAFVRAVRAPRKPAGTRAPGPLRALVIVARPVGTDDVPFRSVAPRIVAAAAERGDIRVDVLRPPTPEAMSARLREAAAAGQRYDIVHFDGHGTYGAPSDRATAAQRGRLWLENGREGGSAVTGEWLVAALVPNRVRLVTLNACRSARQDAGAMGSLADELVLGGVAGVVAMQQNIYVDAAARFVSGLYEALVAGRTLGEAGTAGRRALRAEPERDVLDIRPLQDWSVPVVYEQRPMRLPRTRRRASGERRRAPLVDFPDAPTTGFVGRDDALLDLERAFASADVVLVHGYAGSGKTATAAEFARWFVASGGAERALFSPLSQRRSAGQVLDALEHAFAPELAARGVAWLTLGAAERIEVARELLGEHRTLWVWDDVEGVSGLPRGSESAWPASERRHLTRLLRDLPARFLLTSRRQDEDWARRVRPVWLGPMPMRERVQLARAIMAEHGHPSDALPAYRALLEFSDGNPLMIRVVVGQAARAGIDSTAAVAAFVDTLRSGAAELGGDAGEGWSSFLEASLAYGLRNTFDERESALLAVLHLFRAFVDVTVLGWMGEGPLGGVAALQGVARRERIRVLDRAAEIGLLARLTDGGYTIHPALPGVLKRLFDRHHPDGPGDDSPAKVARRSYARSIAAVGRYYHDKYVGGDRTALRMLALDEADLLHARALARTGGWDDATIGASQGLRTLYEESGRYAEWRRIVEETVPLFVDRSSDGPRAGCSEHHWQIVTEYRVQLVRRAGDLEEAERLGRLRVDRARWQAKEPLARPWAELDDDDRTTVDALAAAIGELAFLLEQGNDPGCLALYREVIQVRRRMEDPAGEAVAWLNLGNAYTELCAPPDLDAAECCFESSLNLRVPGDRLGRSRGYSGLGYVALMRFRAAFETSASDEEILQMADVAEQLYLRALRLAPAEAVEERAVVHNQLGVVLDESGRAEKAVLHFRASLRLEESRQDRLGAAHARKNLAQALGNNGQFADAETWARQALTEYEALGTRAQDFAEATRGMIDQIQALRSGA